MVMTDVLAKYDVTDFTSVVFADDVDAGAGRVRSTGRGSPLFRCFGAGNIEDHRAKDEAGGGETHRSNLPSDSPRVTQGSVPGTLLRVSRFTFPAGLCGGPHCHQLHGASKSPSDVFYCAAIFSLCQLLRWKNLGSVQSLMR